MPILSSRQFPAIYNRVRHARKLRKRRENRKKKKKKPSLSPLYQMNLSRSNNFLYLFISANLNPFPFPSSHFSLSPSKDSENQRSANRKQWSSREPRTYFLISAFLPGKTIYREFFISFSSLSLCFLYFLFFFKETTWERAVFSLVPLIIVIANFTSFLSSFHSFFSQQF